MTDKPIIFSAPMVRALLDGRKTQTRRVIKVSTGPIAPGDVMVRWGPDFGGQCAIFRPRYAPGDRLWVREALRSVSERDADGTIADCISYAADGAYPEHGLIEWPWQRAVLPSIHMPRWASRITLTVTDVRVQRLQEISEADARAEGIEQGRSGRFYDPVMSRGAAAHFGGMHHGARAAFQSLWNSLHGPEAWDANPWVVALTFTVDRRNIDAQETKP